MKILLTNDDGYDAEGLQGLYAAIARDHECYIVAPDLGRSCCGHAVTNGSPLEITKRIENGWAISGTPADCVRVALLWLKLRPDLVVSGLNEGGNLGVDILYSGTVAAAREAAMMGVRSIAMSQYMRRDLVRDWNVNGERAYHVLKQVVTWQARDFGFWSINMPALPVEHPFDAIPILVCDPEPQPLEFEYRSVPTDSAAPESVPNPKMDRKQSVIYQSNYQSRPRNVGSDVDLCFAGKVTSSWISSAVRHRG